MNDTISQRIARELSVRDQQVHAAINLLDEGASVPFIARYRKEVTGGLDDTQMRRLEERLLYLRDLEDRRQTILDSITEQGKLDAALQAAILQAGKDAGAYGRILESSEDIQKLKQMEKEGKLKTVYFKERDALVKAAEPVIKAYFKENNASAVLDKIMKAQ